MATLPCSMFGFMIYNIKADAYLWFGHKGVAIANSTDGHVVHYPKGKK